jgi:DNA-binding NtrC family response regulator
MLNVKSLKSLELNGTLEVPRENKEALIEAINEVTASNPAYQFSVVREYGTLYATRVLPTNFIDRGKFFDTVKKTQIQKALKANNFVKTRAAESLGMSLRTFRRKLDVFELSF